MKIQIKNIGPVGEAEIDLSKKLIVFCGPNGTGKTYCAYTLYAFAKQHLLISLPPLSGIEEKKIEITESGDFLIEIDAELFFAIAKDRLSRTKRDLPEYFAIPQYDDERFAKKLNVQFTHLESIDSVKQYINELTLDTTLLFSGVPYRIIKSSNNTSITLTPNKSMELSEDGQEIIITVVLQWLAFMPLASAVILPVERNSIFSFSRELSVKRQDLLDNLQSTMEKGNPNDLENYRKRLVRYTKPVRDALRNAEELDVSKKRRSSHYYDFAVEMEKRLLNGSVTINEDGSVLFTSARANDVALSFQQSSSIVKAMASLILYLKHDAQPNDLIIIDEPELNLHPDNQILIARLFAQMINRGLRMVVSTHSDYIVRELNNLIMLGSTINGKKKSERKKITQKFGYREDEYLDKNEVGAYLFNFQSPESPKSKTTPIPVTEEGFDIITIDNLIDNLNSTTLSIYNTLKFGARDE
ncbi:MAG: hypothetical protein EBX41_08090 [Chitinophagia bacterium]|nr:hypothetical protein [Chitinophagia bacterium]